MTTGFGVPLRALIRVQCGWIKLFVSPPGMHRDYEEIMGSFIKAI